MSMWKRFVALFLAFSLIPCIIASAESRAELEEISRRMKEQEEETRRWEEQYGSCLRWRYDTNAAYAAQNHSLPGTYNPVMLPILPGPQHITEAEAIAIAREALPRYPDAPTAEDFADAQISSVLYGG